MSAYYLASERIKNRKLQVIDTYSPLVPDSYINQPDSKFLSYDYSASNKVLGVRFTQAIYDSYDNPINMAIARLLSKLHYTEDPYLNTLLYKHIKKNYPYKET